MMKLMKRITNEEYANFPGQHTVNVTVPWLRSLDLRKGPVVLDLVDLPEHLRGRRQIGPRIKNGVAAAYGRNCKLSIRTFSDGSLAMRLIEKTTP